MFQKWWWGATPTSHPLVRPQNSLISVFIPAVLPAVGQLEAAVVAVVPMLIVSVGWPLPERSDLVQKGEASPTCHRSSNHTKRGH